LCVDDFTELEVTSSLVELVSLHQELKQGVRLLGTVLINLGHVEIVNEQNELLAGSLGTVLLKGALVNVLFKVLLEVSRGSS
jgi:hypothetical protein